jgi:2-polyprenyl-3-methyl-5-hydroxy-6-metoxy-1,4-benzoquinol methylase
MDAGSREELAQTFESLFDFLRSADYAWETLSPDRLARCRQAAQASTESFDPLTRFFGLGLEVCKEELLAQGLPEELLPEILSLRPAISRARDHFIPHFNSHSVSHLQPAENIYLGPESFELLRLLEPNLSRFQGKNALDLGSGAGLLSFELAAHTAKVLGIEASGAAVEWANAAALAQGVSNIQFRQAWIGTPGAARAVQESGLRFDHVVFNPPMAVPTEGPARTHRDGGAQGIELPLKFLEFAGACLRPGGEVHCLITNPITLQGRSVFFERLAHEQPGWTALEKRRLNPCFNQSLYRKQRYEELGIQRVELWFLNLRA